jgi:hypothetical protein
VRLLLLLAIAFVLAHPLLDPAIALAASVPLVLAVVSGLLIAFDRERTLAGEAIIATCLASAAVPVAIAAGWSMRAALAALFAWSIGMVAATIAVRGVIAARKRGAAPSRSAMLVALAPLVALVLAALHVVSFWTVAAPLPIVLVALFVAARPPHPRMLKTIGWTLVASTLATAALIGVGIAT